MISNYDCFLKVFYYLFIYIDLYVERNIYIVERVFFLIMLGIEM